MKNTVLLPLILTTALAGTGLAIAQAPAAPAAGPAAMGFGQITEALQRQGYRDIHEVERESDKLYEVKAYAANGDRVELYVDARSGEVLKTETKRPRKRGRD
ncbi:MAG: PepSY domain-containing protein [Hydrogenophaga sp.]|nr:PepSY domain-containing protein [Hydrogenophaga sp.]